MIKKLIGIWLLALVVLPALPAAGQDEAATKEEKIAALTEQRDKLAENVAEAQKLLAQKPGGARESALKRQLTKWQERIRELDRQVAELRGEPAPGEGQPELDEEMKEEIAKIRRRIVALVNRIKERNAEIARLPKDEPAPTVQPGLQGGNDGAPVEMVPPGGLEGDLGAMGEGVGPGQPQTKRQRLLARQREDFAELAELQARLEELERGPRLEELPGDNIPELNPLTLFDGSLDQNKFGLQLGSWGSGQAQENDWGITEARHSLLVYTDGYYRGARFDFASEPVVKLYFEKPEISYLQMDIYFLEKEKETANTEMGGEMVSPEGMETGLEGMPPGMTPGEPLGGVGAPGDQSVMPAGAPGAGDMQPGMEGMPTAMEGVPPGMEGLIPPGMEGAVPGEGMAPEMGSEDATGLTQDIAQAVTVKAEPATRSLRVVLQTDRGPVVAEDFYFDHTYEVYPGWTRIFIPVVDFVNPSERAPEKLARMMVFGDTVDEFYIGMMRFVADEVPIQPQILGPAVITDAVAGEEIKLQSVVEAGLSIVDYTWDWGDGDVEETEEPDASHLYVKAGEYTVTLTCRDKDGHKEPGTTTVKINVKPFASQERRPTRRRY